MTEEDEKKQNSNEFTINLLLSQMTQVNNSMTNLSNNYQTLREKLGEHISFYQGLNLENRLEKMEEHFNSKFEKVFDVIGDRNKYYDKKIKDIEDKVDETVSKKDSQWGIVLAIMVFGSIIAFLQVWK